MKNYVQDGQFIDFVMTSSTVAGTAYYINDIVVVAAASVVASPAKPARCPMLTYGVVELPKNSPEVFVQGQVLYWDNTNKRLTLVSSSNKRCGFSSEPALAGDNTCRVYIYALA